MKKAQIKALIKQLGNRDGSVRLIAAESLEKIGDARVLPRKVLTDVRMSSAQKCWTLEALRGIRGYRDWNRKYVSLRYHLSDVREFCNAVAQEDDPEVAAGARGVLYFLDGGNLLHAASAPSTPPEELLRAATGYADTETETLVQAAEPIEIPSEETPEKPGLLQRLWRRG